MHPRLRAILDEASAAKADDTVKPLSLVAGIKRRPYTSNGFQRMFFGHTAGRLLADRGADPRTIAALLGHRTLAMTAHYSDEADRKKRAAAAVSKLRPGTKVSNARGKSV